MLKHLSSRLLALSAIAAFLVSTSTAGQPFSDPVVARAEMKLAIDEKVVDVIEKGDLLTVLDETDDGLLIRTHDGTEGLIERVNAVKIAESGEIYTDLIQRNPNVGRYYTLRASAWWELGKSEKALEDFDKAIELGYTKAHAYTSRGLFHAEMGDYAKAVADYDEAIKLDPKDIAPLINRASLKLNQREFDAAIDDYTLALEKMPKSQSLLHQRAIAYKAAGKPEEAIADFDAILKENPNYRAAINGRGYIHFQQQEFKKAVEDFTTAVGLNPKDAVAWNNRGFNRHQLGHNIEALEDYDKAISLAPKYAQALQNRAWLLSIVDDEDVHDPKSAIESATEACELTNYESLFNLSALAAALAADGEFDKAVGWQEKVIEMSADEQKDFAEKTLVRYQSERPYALDPDQANAEEKEAAEQEAKKNQQAKSESDEDSNA
jgi:tetratricopeptide (TPR) repeat protein